MSLGTLKYVRVKEQICSWEHQLPLTWATLTVGRRGGGRHFSLSE